jgi:LytR cell envelope-related transcriptional attenuator
MEHAYHRDQPYVRREAVDTPWRTAAIIAAGVAAVELFIIVVIGVVLGAKLLTDSAEKAVITATTAAKTAAGTTPAASKSSSSSSKKAGSASSTPVAKLSRKKTSVVVLNGNGVPGAAAVGAQRLRHFHYIVAATGNAPRTDFNRSLVMYRKGYEGEAIRLAHDLHIRRVAPLDGLSLRDLQGGHVALIIGG